MRGFVDKLFQNDATQEYKFKYPANRMLYSRYCNKLFQNDATQEYKFKYPANRMLYSRYCKYAFKNDTKIYINNEKEIHGVCV